MKFLILCLTCMLCSCASVKPVTIVSKKPENLKLNISQQPIILNPVEFQIQIKNDKIYYVLTEEFFNNLLLNQTIIYHSLKENYEIIDAYKNLKK